MNYYPAFLNLHGKKAVVVGGGRVAERKVLALVKAGADVTVISPVLTRRLLKERDAHRILHLARRYRKGDLKQSFLVIAATDSPEVNTRIAGEAPYLLNVVDVPGECNFIAPSIVKRGQLVFAISTGGTSPAFAKAVRKELEELYGKAFTEYLDFVKELRPRIMEEVENPARRERFLKGLASKQTLEALRTKGPDEVKASVIKRLRVLTGEKRRV
jgi:precorrin-2 dehydrogenase / sirohydrochlorin ferrochelatase